MANLIIQQTIPIIFKKILKDSVSGELIVRGTDFQKNLLFLDGNLIFAKTTSPRERLGEILYKCGKIDEAQLRNIPNLIKNKNEKIGKILVKNNILTQRDVFEGLSRQIAAITISLFSITQGEWDFTRKIPQVPEDSRFNIKLPGIIKEGMRITGNISFFENEFYYQRPKTGIIPHEVSKYLSSDEIKFYKELSNFNNLQVGKIIQALKISEQAFWNKINLFYLLNILDFDETTGSLEDTAVAVDKKVVEIIEEIIVLYNGLREEKLDYYQLLKVARGAPLEDLKVSYRILSDRYNPVSLSITGEIKERATYVFSEIKKAYETLSSKEKKREYDWECYERRVTGAPAAPAALPEISPAKKDDNSAEAEKMFNTAESLYKERKYMEAAVLLEKVVALDNTNFSYHFLLGLAQLEIPLLKRKAERTLLKVCDMDPQNAEPLYALGLLYRAEDMPQKAEVFFRKALEINVDHTLAGKMLDEMEGKDEKDDPLKRRSFFTILGKK
ncbi:MAG: DnaJ domain-containing protein [Candidatus Aminicenantes bacterium]|nr:DnaJ domain-containing protein [Candidatus Aminicenantes bacterium]